jgi:hypothetical protein
VPGFHSVYWTMEDGRGLRIGATFSTMVAAPPPLVAFARLPAGWHSYPGAGPFATSWAYRPGRDSGGWADHMPRGGIAVTVLFPTMRARFGPLKLVLPRRPAVLLEGTTDTPEYRIEGRVHGRNVLVLVDIRRRHPTHADRRVAQEALSAIRFG